MSVKLIDIHHAKDVRNLLLTWAAGIYGLIHKISEGNWFTDPSMIERMTEAWDIGFVLGGYHFFRSNVPGAEQAYYFLKGLEPLRKLTDDKLIPVWADVETIDHTSIKVRMRELLEFLRIVNMEYKLPGVYSSPGFWASNTSRPTWINLYWQWVAHWTPAPVYQLPIGWTVPRSRLWQKGIAGVHSWAPENIPGINGAVDCDLFLGTLEELKAWAGYDAPIVSSSISASISPSASPSAPPNNAKLLEMFNLMLRAQINLDEAIEIARVEVLKVTN